MKLSILNIVLKPWTLFPSPNQPNKESSLSWRISASEFISSFYHSSILNLGLVATIYK